LKVAERRQHGRWDGRILVDLGDPSGLIFEAVALNVSAGGMCLIFPDAPTPRVGAEYDVSFQLPTLPEKVHNAIEVRWIDSVRTKICGVTFVQGLRAIEVYTLNELIKLDAD
jgi:hypothetical protein